MIGSSYFMIIWLWLFFKLRAYRRDILWMSLGASWIGLCATYFWWIKDWWHPITITGTRIGIEDLFMSVSHLGIGVFGYMLIFHKKTDNKHPISSDAILHVIKRFLLWFFLSFGTTFVFFYFLSIRSFESTLAGMIVAGAYLLIKRPDLLKPMTLSGILFLAVALPIYLLLEKIYPLESASLIYYMGKLTGLIFLGIPIEDLIWYWFLGFFLGGAYPYLTKSKYIDNSNIQC